MRLEEAEKIAERVKLELEPHCERIAIAGSIRRKRPEVKDIEIVAIPKEYGTGLFESGVAKVVNQWPKVKGELPCKYTQRVLPEGIKLDLFFCKQANWGLIFAIRTGSAEFSHKVLASTWSSKGYRSVNGMLVSPRGLEVYLSEEKHLFEKIGLEYVEPEDREVRAK